MFHRLPFLLLVILLSHLLSAQQRIDGNFPFATDPAKGYSIYVPSAYVPGVPHRLMVGMHPLNTARWNSISWCDTLLMFAEQNDLLLVCPDGGADGAVDDPIDTAFTTALLDSVRIWYSVDVEKTYIMGFSWGARTAYTYGLSRPSVFNGYLPIGAAINGLNEVDATMQANSSGKPVYIVHGSQDSPATRYTPILNALTSSGAILNSILMNGVGHTIDFQDRNAILGTAFQWIDSVNCANITTSIAGPFSGDHGFRAVPSLVESGGSVVLTWDDSERGHALITLVDLKGATLMRQRSAVNGGRAILTLPELPAGAYVIRVSGAVNGAQRMIVR